METEENDVRYLKEQIGKKIIYWLAEALYWYGWQRGVEVGEQIRSQPPAEGKSIYLHRWAIQPGDLEFRWFTAYSHYYLTIKDDRGDRLSDFIIAGKRLDEIVAINQNEARELKAHHGEELAKRLEELVKQFFSGIEQTNGLRICPSPAHWYNRKAEVGKGHPRPHLSVCYSIKRNWLCESCIEQFGLGEVAENKPSFSLKKYQVEWARLTPARRLEVLERDQYTCQKCERNPKSTEGLRLGIGYIIPIENGGKSALENLMTLCQECNSR